MIKRYIIYIYNSEYSGYYTGAVIMSQYGYTYPGIVAIKNSQNIRMYASVKACKEAIQQTLVPMCPDVCRFDIIEKFSDSLVYRATYKNKNMESEQKF